MVSHQEFPQHAIANSIHAEQTAVTSAGLAGETGLEALAVSAMPCGHCRQFLYEVAEGHNLKVLVAEQQPQLLSALLPGAFGPADLNVTEHFLAHKPVRLRAIGRPQVLREGEKVEAQGADVGAAAQPLVEVPANAAETKAAVAAQRSYAPFSKAYAGVAVVLRDGRVLEGFYIENAAFNPSMPPLQVALVNLAIHNAAPKDIVSVVLAERYAPDAVSHRHGTEVLLADVAPQARLVYIPMELRPARAGSD